MLSKESLEGFDKVGLDWPWPAAPNPNQIYRFESSGSGGYCEHIFKYAAKSLFDDTVGKLEFKSLRNPDFKEITLERNGEVLLRFAIANGFRNIQNLVQKLKRGKSVYNFVEVMACPSGCLNGGAQIRPEQGMTTKELCSSLEDTHKDLPTTALDAQSDDVTFQKLYNFFFGGYQSDKAAKLLHTNYHAVEKMNTALNIKW